MYRLFFKRVLDLTVSIMAIILLLPLILISAVLVKLTSPGPILFVQERVGKDGRMIRLLKLRTMTNKERVADREIKGRDSEVTTVGHILRRLKIDELPQVFNVLIGDMSIVGPRPFLANQLEKLDENGKWRLKVRPGLTGLSQINGNIYLSWPERWVYDRMYVEKLSFLLDLRIILKTFAIVVMGEKKFAKSPDA